MARLGDVFSLIRNGASIKQTDGAQGIPITRIETISLGEVDRNKLGYANIFDVAKYRDFLLKDGDILMSHINSEKHLGKTAIYSVQQDEKLIHGMNLLLLRANSDLIIPKYAFYYFNSPNFLYQIPNITKKSVNQASFTVTALKELTIPILPIAEQQKIVTIFDLISNLINDNKAIIKKLDNIVKSRFIEMFGNIDSKIKVSSVAKVSGGYAFKSSDIGDSGVRILQIGNVALMDVDWSTSNFLPLSFLSEYSQFALSINDIVMALTRPIIRSLGNVKTCMVREQDLPCLLNQRVGRISTFSANKQYLYYCFMTDEFTQYVDECSIGCSQPNISTKDIENYLIPNAPMELQNEFATFVEQTDKLKFEIKQSLEKLETLKKSLMQQYFG